MLLDLTLRHQWQVVEGRRRDAHSLQLLLRVGLNWERELDQLRILLLGRPVEWISTSIL